MNIDLDSFELKDLKDLQTRVARAITTFEERKKRLARAELEERARELGFSFAELSDLSVPRKRSAAAPKYANPANPSQTWTGRGRKPGWFVEALENGKSATDLEI